MSKKAYFLSDRPQLIDLNGNHVNFVVEFQVKAKEPGTTFQTIVLTQEQLDSLDLEKIEMKQAKEQIGGTITANNDKYQNYFLILRKSTETQDSNPTEVEVMIQIKDTPPVVSPSILNKESSPATLTSEDSIPSTVIPLYKKPWFWVFLLVIVAFGSLYYYYYIYKTKEHKSTLLVDTPPTTLPGTTTPESSLSEEARLYHKVTSLGKV